MLQGIIPPVVTPFKDDESLDLDALRRHIDWQLGHKVHGIFVLGTTGEFYALSEGEKQAVAEAAVGHVGGRAKVYVGTGAETTGEVVRLSKMAAAAGQRECRSSPRTSSSRPRASCSTTSAGWPTPLGCR